ncbi:hypothetical protein Pla108_08950 [Botrimarina colliarenosi]|uniref:Uncharacterized protein n=1 Tax=Botrimarina colliarenosi TaxID=2528001 RepID=A0A5C6ALN9_9BACT|nr:hypothetical protein [Botrimarina colliarenosi]TWT99951.1 hypothetical protein Pla108_08950 [Botrimarina colliarenosi]
MRFEEENNSGRQAAGDSPIPPSAFRLPPLGMTLVELLVVIVLVTTLVSTAIPIISPGGDNRKLRESSRNLNAYLQGAQARAIETGRPFGVSFQRLSADTGSGADNAVCVRMEYVEVPPWYSGFSPTSAVRISPAWVPTDTSTPPNRLFYDPSSPIAWRRIGPVWIQFVQRGPTPNGSKMPPGWVSDLTPPQFFRPGDTIEVHGQRYTLLDRAQANSNSADLTVRSVDGYYPGTVSGSVTTLLAKPEGLPNGAPIEQLPTLAIKYDANGNAVSSSSPYDEPFWTEPTPYKIYRQPVSAGGEPLELPTGVAVDLQASVFGNGTRVYQPHVDYVESAVSFTPRTDNVMVLFSPEGSIDRVYGLVDATGQEVPPTTVTSYLALCVGRRDLIPAKPRDAVSQAAYAEPIDLYTDVVQPGLNETEATELTDQYNWLNLETRWVLVGGQSGSVSTIETSAPYYAGATNNILMQAQLGAALENAPRRNKAGSR